jgi:energy-coupling factor transporter ATP-binding protein EcfA2
MHIEKLFSKELARNIEGVVQVNVVDNASVKTELEEYVVTDELLIHFRRFFEHYLPAVQSPNDPSISSSIGVWVSGFFGSGKSHFLKILSYLLSNQTVDYNGKQTKAIEFFDEKIKDRMLYGDIHAAVHRDTEVILFNIDSRANPEDKENAILKVFLKVFNERLGYSGDYPHLANMERMLDDEGLYQSFKDEFFNLTQATWERSRKKFNFKKDQMVKTLCKVTGQSEDSAREWVNSLKTDFPLDISNFCNWVKEYLDKNPERSIVFLVDEVGQFIGDNTQMMLKLQTITEDLGSACGGRAWIIVTSQSDIDAALGDLEVKKGNDFSKIQGRFKTRLSLSSANTNEVIQKRLLMKSDEARGELGGLFSQKGDVLKNQLSFDNTTTAELANYSNNIDFIDNYPFIPYQYALVQKVFESVRNAGATGKHLSRGERSLLDAFQNAALQVKDENVGCLIPFYRFYPPIEEFLDTSVKNTIIQGCSKKAINEFDGNILKTLFLLRYVKTVSSTLENLVTLTVDQIDADKIILKKKIEDSLMRLEREVLISRNDNLYIFLTNEEVEIQNEIKRTQVEYSEQTSKLAKIMLGDVITSGSKYRYPVNSQDFEISRYCNGVPQDGKIDNDLVLKIVSPLQVGYKDYEQDSYCISTSSQDNGCVLIRLPEDKKTWNELSVFLQTEEFLKHNNKATRPEQDKLLSEKGSENAKRGKNLKTLFNNLVEDADIFAIGNKLNPKGVNFTKIVEEAYKYVIENSFKYLNILKASDDPLRELKAILSADDIGQLGIDINDPNQNAQAILELNRYIQGNDELNRAIYLKDILGHFGRRPYGWRREEVMVLLAKLGLAGKVSYTLQGNELPLKRSYDAFNSVRSHSEFRIRRTRQHSDAQLRKVKQIAKNLFHKPFNGNDKELAELFVSHFEQWEKDLKVFQQQANSVSMCPGKKVIDKGLQLMAGLTELPSDYVLIERIIQDSDQLDEFAEDLEDLSDFFTRQFDTWKQLAIALNSKFKANIQVLEKDAEASPALKKLNEIFESDNPYNQLKDVSVLISKVEKANQAILEKRRTHALARVDVRIQLIESELNNSHANSELCNKALYALQDCRKQIQSTQVLAEIVAGQADSKELETDALELINLYLQQQQKLIKLQLLEKKRLEDANKVAAKGEKVEPSPGQPAKPEPAPITAPKVTSKPIKTLDPTDIDAAPGFIETQEQIDTYLNALRNELETAIKEGNRVRLDYSN